MIREVLCDYFELTTNRLLFEHKLGNETRRRSFLFISFWAYACHLKAASHS